MCRLYAMRSSEPTKVECTLVHSQNALLLQSRQDMTGRTHSDGWGIAYYSNSQPTIERQASAAFTDLGFSQVAERVYARTVIAHVRLATVGELRPENTHPFSFERWAFAHNGTVEGFESLRTQLITETLPVLNATRLGGTDSEYLFLWLLSRLVGAGVDLASGITDLTLTASTVANAIRELAARSSELNLDNKPKLNIVLTDGDSMIATRWNNSLFYLQRGGLHDCDICGIPHVHHTQEANYRATVIASEPLSGETWIEVPNKSVIRIDSDARMELEPIGLSPASSGTTAGA
ncbi:MAG: class II glutamine amidotransferase [Planctomycetaceae bacterium]